MASVLSFPYYTYPGILCSGYQNTSTYNIELQRLYRDIIELEEIHEPTLLHITIGAAMEEMIVEHFSVNSEATFQWKQLLPNHIFKAIKRGIKIIHLVISPNKNFSYDEFIDPLFVTKTLELEWDLYDDRKYTSRKYPNYKVWFYCTMMPSTDLKNESVIKYLRTNLTSDLVHCVNKFEQTFDDRNFIEKFYEHLALIINIINSNGGICTCFSFAVFNAETTNSHINNYVMFPELLEIFKHYPTNILAEWVFRETNYLMTPCKYCGYRCDNISYVEPTQIYSYGHQLSIHKKRTTDGIKLYVQLQSYTQILKKRKTLDKSKV